MTTRVKDIILFCSISLFDYQKTSITALSWEVSFSTQHPSLFHSGGLQHYISLHPFHHTLLALTGLRSSTRGMFLGLLTTFVGFLFWFFFWLIFNFVPCGKRSWLPVSFWGAYVKYRDLRIVFLRSNPISNRPSDSISNRIFESAVYTTQAVTPSNELQGTPCRRTV